jgi:hypothetical protein
MIGGCTLTKPAIPTTPTPVATVPHGPVQPGGPPGPAGPGGPPETEAIVAAEYAHKLSTLEEERNALVLHVQHLQTTLVDKDKALLAAGQEVQAAAAEVERSRADMQKWKNEIDQLREMLRTSEKENAATLQSVVGLLEQMTQDRQPDPYGKPAGK